MENPYKDWSYDHYLSKLNETWAKFVDPKEMRYGQLVFNSLVHVRPKLAEAIRSSTIDPFYRNEDVDPKTWEFLKENWDNDNPTYW